VARTGRPVIKIELTDDERGFLEQLQRNRRAPASEFKRARAILLMAEGEGNKAVAKAVGLCAQTIGTLRRKFAEVRLGGLSDLPRPGAPRTIEDDKVHRVIEKTLRSIPEGATHWSTRKMAKECALSHDSVARIWKTFGLRPHRSESFQISTDPYYVEKIRDVVGLYMSPPENALVLSVDEKSQIQALQRSQPVLPLRSGQPERHTPEYFRHGTLSLFAALDVKKGEVLGTCYRRHRAAEFLAFLKEIERHVADDVAEGKSVHLILDNYCTHKAASVTRWLARRPHWHLHFTPTHASWLNQVERFFAKITNEAIRRGNFHSVPALKKAIDKYLEVHNREPKPFKWTKDADAILEKNAKLCKTLV
jgi:transposase